LARNRDGFGLWRADAGLGRSANSHHGLRHIIADFTKQPSMRDLRRPQYRRGDTVAAEFAHRLGGTRQGAAPASVNRGSFLPGSNQRIGNAIGAMAKNTPVAAVTMPSHRRLP
jgi:hypothetical protein